MDQGKTCLFLVLDRLWKEKSSCSLSAGEPSEKISPAEQKPRLGVLSPLSFVCVSVPPMKGIRDRAASHADIDITWHLLEIKVDMTRSLFLRQS